MSFTKIMPYKDQVELELNRIMPFGGYSFDLFKGLLFEEILDNIRNIGIRKPIIVRSIADRKYEILDGHYRVAVARKLKSVPAIILEGITDEEALLYVSELNPIGLILKYDIDICDDSYSMALDEYIEHFLLTEYELYDSYTSIYDMGNPYKLDEEECEYDALAHYILKMDDPDFDSDEVREWEKSNDRSNIISAREVREAEGELV